MNTTPDPSRRSALLGAVTSVGAQLRPHRSGRTEHPVASTDRPGRSVLQRVEAAVPVRRWASEVPVAQTALARWTALDWRVRAAAVGVVVAWFVPRQAWISLAFVCLVALVGSVVVRVQWQIFILGPLAGALRAGKSGASQSAGGHVEGARRVVGRAYGWMHLPAAAGFVVSFVFAFAHPYWH